MTQRLVPVARIVALFRNPVVRRTPMERVKEMCVTVAHGIVNNPKRTFDHRPPRQKGDEDPRLRDIALIHTAELRNHEIEMKLRPGYIGPGAVRANIELVGVTGGLVDAEALLATKGSTLYLGTKGARIECTYQRDPCGDMNRIAKGLCDRMRGGRQGIFARVTGDGSFNEGDYIYKVVVEELPLPPG